MILVIIFCNEIAIDECFFDCNCNLKFLKKDILWGMVLHEFNVQTALNEKLVIFRLPSSGLSIIIFQVHFMYATLMTENSY